MIRIEGFKFRIIPLIVVILTWIAITLLAGTTMELAEHFFHIPVRPEMPWIELSYGHTAELFYTLIAIGLFKIFLRRDYGLHRPEGKSYVGAAILWGLLFGALMTAAKFWPEILAHRPPSDQPYPLTPINIAGWLGFQGVYAGPTEEPLLRGLLVTYLMATLPGRVVLGRYEMSVAGVLVALFVAFTYAIDFLTKSFVTALGQFLIVFVSGALFAYWFEKSRSLLAPVVGHNVGDAVEYVLIFAMVAMWH